MACQPVNLQLFGLTWNYRAAIRQPMALFGNLESLGWACKLLYSQWWLYDGLHLVLGSFLLGSLRGLLELYEEAQFSQIISYTHIITRWYQIARPTRLLEGWHWYHSPWCWGAAWFSRCREHRRQSEDFVGLLKYCHAPVPLHLFPFEIFLWKSFPMQLVPRMPWDVWARMTSARVQRLQRLETAGRFEWYVSTIDCD